MSELNPVRIAVIGAGPSGLSCAYYLQLSGYSVEVFESESVAGGVLAYGIPEYRLPKAVLNRDIQAIEATGVQIHLNTTVGEDVSFDELYKKFHAVYVSTGTQLSRKANIPGEDMPGVYHGLDFLKAVNLGKPVEIGKKVAAKALEKGITEVVFDRGGYVYHGRVKALADGAREGGLKL